MQGQGTLRTFPGGACAVSCKQAANGTVEIDPRAGQGDRSGQEWREIERALARKTCLATISRSSN